MLGERRRAERGAAFNENGPNVTEDVGHVIRTILVGSDRPADVQSSGIELNTGESSEIISS